MTYTNYYFAQAYGSGTYDSSTYENSTTGSSTGGSSTPTTGSGTLTNTGFDLVLAATLACCIIFVALIVRFWKRPTKRTD